MIDCLSNGRLISGFARGIPREYQVHNVPLADCRARFEEAYDIVTRAWTEDVFSYQGKFWSYKDVAIWPRPVQQPHPAIWMPIVGSKELIEFAGRHNIPITPGSAARRPARRHHPLLRQVPGRSNGHRITPDHLSLGITPMSPIQQGAGGEENAGRITSISTARCSATATSPRPSMQRRAGYVHAVDRLRPPGEPARRRQLREDFRNMTMADVERQAEKMPMGHRRRGRPTHHRRGRKRRRRPGADQPQPRRHAARDVHGADRALRPRGAAGAAGAPGDTRAAWGGYRRLTPYHGGSAMIAVAPEATCFPDGTYGSIQEKDCFRQRCRSGSLCASGRNAPQRRNASRRNGLRRARP